MKLDVLTPLQERFVEAYCKHQDHVDAAEEAGYACSRIYGARLIRHPKIIHAISKRMGEAFQHGEVDVSRVVEELKVIAFSRIDDYEVDGQGKVKAKKGAPPGAMGAISSVTSRAVVDKNGEIVGYDTQIKLWDKGKALEHIGKWLGMYEERVRHIFDEVNQLDDLELAEKARAALKVIEGGK